MCKSIKVSKGPEDELTLEDVKKEVYILSSAHVKQK